MGWVAYENLLDPDLRVVLHVEFTTAGREVLSYSVVLTVGSAQEREAVRVYDATHRLNEMHRYRQGDDKQPGVPFHAGTLAEGMRMAILEIKDAYREMIEGWKNP